MIMTALEGIARRLNFYQDYANILYQDSEQVQEVTFAVLHYYYPSLTITLFVETTGAC